MSKKEDLLYFDTRLLRSRCQTAHGRSSSHNFVTDQYQRPHPI